MASREPYPSYCCQRCGEQIGWLGRFVEWVFWNLHRCPVAEGRYDRLKKCLWLAVIIFLITVPVWGASDQEAFNVTWIIEGKRLEERR